MKTLIVALAIVSFSAISGYAQVGVTTNSPDASAALDLSASNKGLLIPRVNLLSATDANTIPSPAQRLLVYNTSTNLTGGAGYYYWDTNTWKKLITSDDVPRDNLGNHTATKNLTVGSNSISNDGGANEGLMFDTTGNAIFQQQLTVKNLPNAGATEMVITSDANGTLKRGTIDLSDIPRRTNYNSPTIPAGTSTPITLTNNPPFAMYVVTTGNDCGRLAIATFGVSGDVITFLSGQGRAKLYVATIMNAAGTSLKLVAPGTLGCGDGGNSTQFDFSISKSGSTITITNNGNISKGYVMRQIEM